MSKSLSKLFEDIKLLQKEYERVWRRMNASLQHKFHSLSCYASYDTIRYQLCALEKELLETCRQCKAKIQLKGKSIATAKNKLEEAYRSESIFELTMACSLSCAVIVLIYM